MPGKVLKPVLADSHCKCDISVTDIDAISALKATREHNLDLDSAMKSEKWKRKKEGTKGVFKAPRNRLQRPHIAKYQDVQVDDDGEDIIETDWVADGGSADWPVVHEVPLVDLLKPGKARSRDPPGMSPVTSERKAASSNVFAAQLVTSKSFPERLPLLPSTIDSFQNQRQWKTIGNV